MKPISKHILKSLGLKEAQAAVYMAALELGQANMQDLSHKSGIKRTSIYNFIEELRERGLITETKRKKRKFYSAVHPEVLIEMEKARITELQGALPELLAIYNKGDKPRVTFYNGLAGIEEVYADMLKDKQSIIAYEDLQHMKAGMRPLFYKNWPTERAKRGITFKSISRDSTVARELVKYNIRLLRETKFIQSNDLKTEINIYGNKVALMSFRSSPSFCVLIEDPDIAETLRTTWKELWDRLGPAIG